MRHCDNCKRLPEPFEVNGISDKGYFFVVPEEDLDPSYLMSDLELSFLACLEENPPEEAGKQFWCAKCVEAILEEPTSEGEV